MLLQRFSLHFLLHKSLIHPSLTFHYQLRNHFAVHALKRGASDFLQKSAKPERLLAAVKKAVTASMEEYESGNEIETLRKIYDSLTPREKEVVLGVAKGELNKVIGYNLGISERTVKMHRANLCSKLNVTSAVEMAAFLRKIGVLNA